MNEVDSDEPPARLRSLSNLQQRFEESRIGQVVISAIIVLVVTTGVAANLPDSPIARTVASVTNPIAVYTGLDTKWAMFAPDPAQRLDKVDVDVTMADGSHVVWSGASPFDDG